MPNDYGSISKISEISKLSWFCTNMIILSRIKSLKQNNTIKRKVNVKIILFTHSSICRKCQLEQIYYFEDHKFFALLWVHNYPSIKQPNDSAPFLKSNDLCVIFKKNYKI